MTIEIFRSEAGFPVKVKEAYEQVLKITIDNRKRFEILPAGFYDLTPKLRTRTEECSKMHFLEVLPNGDGICRGYPRDRNVGAIDLSRAGSGKGNAPGVDIQNLSKDGDVGIVGIIFEDGETTRVYDIMLYTPGPSPEKEQPPINLPIPTKNT